MMTAQELTVLIIVITISLEVIDLVALVMFTQTFINPEEEHILFLKHRRDMVVVKRNLDVELILK